MNYPAQNINSAKVEKYSRHIIIKMLKISDKEKILKSYPYYILSFLTNIESI